jgi:uncharacterized membrane protein YjjP (DUF1212 family)
VNVVLAVVLVAAAWLIGRRYSPEAGVLIGVLAGTVPWIAYLASIAYVEVGMLAMAMCAVIAWQQGTDDEPNRLRWTMTAGLLAGLCCGFKYTAVVLIAFPLAFVPMLWQDSWAKRLRLTVVYSLSLLITFSPWLIRNIVNTYNPVFPLAGSIMPLKDGVWHETAQQRWQEAHGVAGASVEEDESIITLALKHSIGDFRIGIALFALAALGVWRRRDRWSWFFVVMFAFQLMIWATTTHVYARFAVVLLIPLIGLTARVFESLSARWLRIAVVAIAVAGAWNILQFSGLYLGHTRIGVGIAAQKMNLFGRTDWFVEGKIPGHQHLGTINAMPESARVMLVGEARTFYIKPQTDYATVFNHHPLAEAVAELPDPDAVVNWLSQRGVSAVLVHWGELDRLRRTYGLDPELTPELFAGLESAGLRVSEQFRIGLDQSVYATLYEVDRDE